MPSISLADLEEHFHEHNSGLHLALSYKSNASVKKKWLCQLFTRLHKNDDYINKLGTLILKQDGKVLILILYLQVIMQIVFITLKRANLLVGKNINVYKISKKIHLYLLVQIHSFEILQNQRCPVFQYPKSVDWNKTTNQWPGALQALTGPCAHCYFREI